jgi:WD40 repeat protein
MLAGPSGSGKSSVLHAGLLPALRADRIRGARDWLLATMFPGFYPFEELDSALLGVGISPPGDRPPSSTDGLVGTLARVLPGAGEVLLVIDQFEELWSLTDDADRRRRFISELVDAVSDLRSRLRVVVAVRTDFLEHVLDHHLLGELVRRGLVLVTAPSADELAQAISRPARNTGLDFEPGLIDMVVRDVVDQPGALPLLQHALSELYLARDGARLTRAAYRESGGVSGALGRRADEVYRGLPRRAHGVARQIFLRLVAVDEQRNDSRRRVRRSELNALPADPRLVAQVLQEFGAHRLLAFDRDPVTRGPTVEVAHEALFREWRLLRGWIEARREALLRHRGLRVAAADWKSSGEAADYLYAGGRLEEAEQWRASSDISLTADEQRFLTTSREREDNRTRQRLQRRRMTVSAMGVAAVAGISLAAIAFLQLGRAEAGEREAQARALAASSRGQLLIDQDLAVLLAMQAVDISSQGGAQPIIEAVDALHTALAEHRTVASADAGGFFVGFGGNDLLFSAGPPQNQPTIWSATRGEILHRLEPGGEAPTDAAVSAGGRYAAETYADAPTVVWDLANGAVVAQVGEPGLIHDVPALSRDGTLMAEVSISPETGPGADATNIAIYELPAGRRIASFPASAVRELEFGPDGAWLAIAQDDVATIRLMDTRTGETLRTLGVPRDGSGVADIDFDAGFSRMAILAHSPSRIEVVDVADGDLIQRIALGAEPDQVCFVTEGAWVVTEAADEVTQIWDVASGAPVMSLPGSDHQRAMACAADGQSIAVSGAQGYTRVFDLAASASAEVTTFPTEPPAGGFWSPDGAVILWHDGGTIRRYDRDGRPLARTPEEWVGGLPVTALSGDGNLLAAQPAPGPDGRPQLIDLLDAESLEVVGAMDGPGGPLAFSPDGGLLLAGGSAGSLIYDVVSGARLKELTSPVNGEGYFAPSGVFLADAIHAVVQNGAGPEAWIYDVTSGAHVGTICSSDDSNRVALSPSGQLLVTGDYPGSAETWPVDDLLAAARGAPAECVGDGTDPSEAALAARWSAPTQGGLRFSPDGRWLASTSGFDGEFGVWEVATQRPILNMKLDGTVSVLGFSPDGRHLAIGFYEPRGGQHSVRVYALGADELMGIAGAKVTRGMTDEECRTYLEVDACP